MVWSYVNAIGFQSGMGFYLANNEKNFFLFGFFNLCYAIRFKSYAYSSLLNEIIENKDHLDKIHPPNNKNDKIKESKLSKLESNFRKIYNLFLYF